MMADSALQDYGNNISDNNDDYAADSYHDNEALQS